MCFILCSVFTTFPHAFFLTFSKFFSIFSKNFSKCAPFCGFHYTVYMEHKKSDLLSGQNNGFTDIFIIFGIVLCRIAIPPAINSARCKSMIYFLSPARHTLLSHVASGENVGRKPLPSATQRDVTPVLSDDAALFFCYTKKVASKTSDSNRSMRICLAMPRSGGAFCLAYESLK